MTWPLTCPGALITGAASGIGRASALAFASAGASVALLDIDVEGLADTAGRIGGGRARRSAGGRGRDLRAVTGAVGRATEVSGRLDAALNNPGVPGPISAG